MSDVIQLLPDSVANQIAAGEVIQRPASVIKELVENAVDAGARHIDVSVVDAGRTSIQVIDDGKGMSETDARLAFERHATSKIRHAEDLFNLRTMGFRGEALPSIVAVSQVELKTRTADDTLGTDICFSGSKVLSQEPCACQQGANFKVENLFFNVPARRKFLKSNATELNHVITAFERIALVYPDIAFSLHSNGSELYNLRAGTLRQRIVEVFGKRINADLLPLSVETSVCGLSGFVGKPESAKKKGVRQFFFVNGRYMRHPYFHKAVQSVYERMVPQGEQVPYFIYFDINPHDIDVNIHPTKTEIKFENEQTVYQILLAAVRDAVGTFSGASAIEFDVEGKPDIPMFQPECQPSDFAMPKVDFDPQYNPFAASKPRATPKADLGLGVTGAHDVGGGFDGADFFSGGVGSSALFAGQDAPAQDAPDSLFSGPVQEGSAPELEDKAPAHYQYKGKYIMTAVKSGLMVVDQHRAHVRVLYEDYLRRLSNHKIASQKVLFPQQVELSPKEMVTLTTVKDAFSEFGFELSPLGASSYGINAIPEGLEGIDVASLLHDLLSDTDAESPLAKIHEGMAASLAQAAAIPYGQVLSNDEMEDLTNRLFQCSNVNYTPDGRATLCIIKQKDIETMLG